MILIWRCILSSLYPPLKISYDIFQIVTWPFLYLNQTILTTFFPLFSLHFFLPRNLLVLKYLRASHQRALSEKLPISAVHSHQRLRLPSSISPSSASHYLTSDWQKRQVSLFLSISCFSHFLSETPPFSLLISPPALRQIADDCFFELLSIIDFNTLPEMKSLTFFCS